MKNAICIHICLMLSYLSISQNQSPDTNLMTLKAKIKLVEHIDLIKNEEQICSFLSRPITYKLLQSQGFSDNIIFFEIHLDIDSFDAFMINYNFIFAFNAKTEEIYRLKGFEQNDFYTFFISLKYDNIDYSHANVSDLKTSKKFTHAFYVEGLDLQCLFESMKPPKKRPHCQEVPRKLYNTH